MCTMQEPDTSTKLNVGLMKELTGGDKIQARELYGAPIEFKPQFKMILCCNDKPELPPHDEGTWRRVRNTEFISKFTYEKNIDDDNILDFKIDTELSEKFDNWAEPFMSILIHYHNRWKQEGLRTPDEILEYTSEYRECHSHFREFVNDHIDFDDKSDQILKIEKIYSQYRQWGQQYLPSSNDLRKRRELQEYLDDKFAKYCNNKTDKGSYRGLKIKLKKSDNNIIEDDEVEQDELDQNQ